MDTFRGCLPILCGLSMSACVMNSVAGSGKIVSEPRTVSGFSSVSLSGSGRLIVEQTGTESLTVTTDDNLLPYIRTEVEGGRLELGVTDALTNLRPTNDIVFTLTVKQVEGLEISGSGTVDAKGLNPSRLSVEISGSGEVSAQGTADNLNLSISGSGSYRGDQLKSRRADVSVTGSGAATIAASESLNAEVTGSGSIEYSGDPKVTEQVTGSGAVVRR